MTPKKERALHALLTANTLEEAAQLAGVSSKALYNYTHKDTEFMERYEAAKGAMMQEAIEQMQRAFSPAVTLLREVVEDADEEPRVRIQAARSVLEYGIKASDSAHRQHYDVQRLELKAMEVEAKLRHSGEDLPDDGFIAALMSAINNPVENRNIEDYDDSLPEWEEEDDG